MTEGGMCKRKALGAEGGESKERGGGGGEEWRTWELNLSQAGWWAAHHVAGTITFSVSVGRAGGRLGPPLLYHSVTS